MTQTSSDRRQMSASHKGAWRASVAVSNSKPASGAPKSGMVASGLPAMGAGWGGPATGASRERFKPGHAYYPPVEDKRRAIEDLQALMVGIAHDPDQPAGLRLIAADKALYWLVGRPGERAPEPRTYPPIEEINTRDPHKATEHYDEIIKKIG
jgi:hypothetical protein